MTQILTRILVAACLVLAITGCASTEDEKLKGATAEKMYREAKEEQEAKNYEYSTTLFEKLLARFPYGRFAQQAELEIAYNYYKDRETDLGIVAVERFMRQNPKHPNMDYAFYLRGLLSFNEAQGFLTALVKQDMSERDPKNAKESFEAFRELVNRFPYSPYAEDARARTNYLLSALASHELHVARYYYKRGAFLAAANRAKLLLENYSNTRYVEGALGMMVLSYNKLGLNDLRDDAKRVLDKNYPGSKSINDDFTEDRWWWLPL